LRCYKQKSVKVVQVGIFQRGWVTFGKDFGWKETIPSNPRWSGKTTDISVSYGLDILTNNYFVLSQYTHLTDGGADGQAELRQQYRALHYMQSHGKNELTATRKSKHLSCSSSNNKDSDVMKMLTTDDLW